jgi:hypothetical protein
MWKDHIVEEIHSIRERIANFYGNDMHAIFLAAQRGELSNWQNLTSSSEDISLAEKNKLSAASTQLASSHP